MTRPLLILSFLALSLAGNAQEPAASAKPPAAATQPGLESYGTAATSIDLRAVAFLAAGFFLGGGLLALADLTGAFLADSARGVAAFLVLSAAGWAAGGLSSSLSLLELLLLLPPPPLLLLLDRLLLASVSAGRCRSFS